MYNYRKVDPADDYGRVDSTEDCENAHTEDGLKKRLKKRSSADGFGKGYTAVETIIKKS